MAGTGGAGSSVDVKVLVVSGSARTGSLNTQLARLAAEVMVDLGATTEVLTISEFETPGYSQDVEDSTGFPPGAQRLRDMLLAVDALLLVSPEYNFSMPGVVKNIIDWVSRFRPQPFQQKHALLMSASGSMAGGNRDCGRCGSRWNTWACGCSPTCSPSPRRTGPSPRTGN